MVFDVDMPTMLAELAEKRPVFHSEADFQHAFARLISERMPSVEVRLEHPIVGAGRNAVDILLRQYGQIFAIELKYLCMLMSIKLGDEVFELKQQGAQDIRRYDVFKDVARMEQFVRANTKACAAVVVLSNDPAYWTGPQSDSANSAAFSVREGRLAQGVLAWADRAGAGTTKGREQQIILSGRYQILWHDYSRVDAGSGHFRYLHIPVD